MYKRQTKTKALALKDQDINPQDQDQGTSPKDQDQDINPQDQDQGTGPQRPRPRPALAPKDQDINLQDQEQDRHSSQARTQRQHH